MKDLFKENFKSEFIDQVGWQVEQKLEILEQLNHRNQ